MVYKQWSLFKEGSGNKWTNERKEMGESWVQNSNELLVILFTSVNVFFSNWALCQTGELKKTILIFVVILSSMVRWGLGVFGCGNKDRVVYEYKDCDVANYFGGKSMWNWWVMSGMPQERERNLCGLHCVHQTLCILVVIPCNVQKYLIIL